jgi:hypothetical protein
LREGTSLTVDDFNAHWNIRRGDLTPVDYRQDPEQVIPRGRPQNVPIVPQGDFLPTLKSSSMTFDWLRSYSWRQSGERMMPRTTRPTRPIRTMGDDEGEDREDKDDSVGAWIGTWN